MAAASQAQEIPKNDSTPSIMRRVVRRLRKCCSATHLFTYSLTAGEMGEPQRDQPSPGTQGGVRVPLEFKRILLSDDMEIDAIADIDPWRIPKSVSIDMLREGWVCLVAKKQGRVVACTWATVNDFTDQYLNRAFVLGPLEAYHWRGFCAAHCRGEGVFPQLLAYATGYIKSSYGKTSHLAIVRVKNEPIKHCLAKIGWRCVGRLGFVQVFGLRVHYLWGKWAFRMTKRRIFVQPWTRRQKDAAGGGTL